MIALIDGDILVYECGFSSDANAVKDAKEAGDYVEGVAYYEPVEYCLKIVKNKIEEICKITEADAYEIYLTGDNNFRLDILPEYKGNRDPDHKPHWYTEIKEYLIQVHNAIVVDGMEADDAMGIAQCNSEEWTCIASKDKDLDCIPGWHYNWSPSKPSTIYWQAPIDAWRFFYTQCLTGDPTDNIPGLFKRTGQRATARLKAAIQDMEDPQEMHKFVGEMYGDTPWKDIHDCLWILREERV